jgi:methyl-accepting chemotaxis protein
MKLKIGTKIQAGYLVVLLFLMAVAAFAIKGMTGMEDSYNKIINVNMPTIVSVWEAQYYEQEMRSNVRAFMLYKDAKYEANFYATEKSFKEQINELNNLVQTQESKDYIAKLQVPHDSYFQVAKEIITLVKNNQMDGAKAHAQLALPHAKTFDSTAKEFNDFATKTIESWVNDAKAKATRTRNLSIIIALSATLLGVGIGIFLTRSISKPVVSLTKAANLLAEGDLTAQIPSIRTGDELEQLGLSFSTMVDNIRMLIKNITQSSQQVASTSEELSSTSEEVSAAVQQVAQSMEEMSRGHLDQASGINKAADLTNQLNQSIGQIASGAQEQALNVSQTSQIIEQMVQGINEVATNTQRVSQGAKAAADTAEEGGRTVTKTIAGMRRIKTTVLDSASRIKDLGEQSQQIGEIIQVIDDIAEQTNLLALNAAIEAARAGEHGKGFAVVADEVRKLAERSSRATKEIATLINNIQSGTTIAVEAMEIGTKEVEEGAQLADDAGEALKKILITVTEANDQIQSITAAVEQVSASNTEVVKAVDNVAAITQQNTAATQEMSANSSQVEDAIQSIAAIAEQSSAATQEVSASTEEINASTEEIASSAQALSQMAQQLQQMVSKFKI